MPPKLARLRRMAPAEIAWRSGEMARTTIEYGGVAARGSKWNRRSLRRILSSDPSLAPARAAAGDDRWSEAGAALSKWFVDQPQRFVVAPSVRNRLRDDIISRFPDSEQEAVARADRVLAGSYDLLGYRGLRFDASPDPAGGAGPQIDWHSDPVHNRRAPFRFWARVPFLDPACGDHKIIWELNRHQHWLTLGRAFWLTGDDRYRSAAQRQLTWWLADNPPLIGINWASMLELAFRSVSWVWALNLFADPEDESPWTVDLLIALDRQLDHVERHLSYYFSPNTHLLGEALALYVCGLAVPLLARSSARVATGRRILLAEASRQITSDGGHCERSAHYHRYALDFYLLALVCAHINHDPAAGELAQAVERLAHAARVLCDQQGRLPHLGDDDGGMAAPLTGRDADDMRDSLAIASLLLKEPALSVGAVPEEAFWLLSHPMWLASLRTSHESPTTVSHIPSAALPETGYYVSRSANGSHVVFDAGPHGFANAGHAHADALALTLTVRNTPLLIDAGTGCYTIDCAARDRFRSTLLHNTVTVDERPSSEPRGPFHWLTMAGTETRRWCTGRTFDYADARHNGYEPIVHRRHVLVVHDDLVLVADLIAGPGVHRADACWHLAPGWDATLSNARGASLTRGSLRVQLGVAGGDLAVLTATGDGSGLGWHAPVYGRVEPISTIRVTKTAATPFWLVTAIGIDAGNAVEQVDLVPVWAEAGRIEHAVAVKIRRQTTVDRWLIAEPAQSGPMGVWRVGSMETDARMLWWRADSQGRVMRLTMVDGTRLHSAGHEDVHIDLASPVPTTHIELHRDRDHAEAHLGSPADARVRIDGQLTPVVADDPNTLSSLEPRRNAGGYAR